MDIPPVPWWNRLGVRLAAAITLVVVATLSLFGMLMVNSQRDHLVRQAQHSAAIVSDTITSSIHNDMLIDRREEAYRQMDAIARQPQIERLRVVDGAGTIRYSRDKAEIGTTVELRDPSCFPCHRERLSGQRTDLTMEARTHVTERKGVPVVGAITPIYNDQSCAAAACHVHPARQAILGVVDLGLTLESVEAESATLRRNTILLGALATVALAVLALFFVRVLVNAPMLRLMGGIRRFAAGELDAAIPVGGSGEFRVLEESFNEMGRALGTARAARLELLNSLEQQVRDRTAALERAQAQLVQTEKLSSLGKLAASIAHEINNPLAGILTTAKLLLRTLDDADTPQKRDKFERRLNLVQRETERCTAIVRNLLNFARERPLTVAPLDLNTAVEEALFLANNQISLQGITLRKELAPVPPAEGDFGQVRQALANIILNACDAMPQGGALTVATRLAPQPGFVEVAVRDTGTGIPKEVLAKVLDPFFTTKEKGTGLGLSVVYGIVEKHGGHLRIDSEVGVGTTVTIELKAAGAGAAVGNPQARPVAAQGQR